MARRSSRGGARTNIEFGNLGDRRRGKEVIRKTVGLVDELAVGGHAAHREASSGLQELWRGCLSGCQQRGFQRRCHQRLQIAAADLRIGVLGIDDLALLSQPDLTFHGARRLRQDGLIARPAAAPHSAAPAMEQAKCQSRLFVEELGQRRRCPVQFPIGREVATILVAVRIAEHHVLHRP
jgi:hypothetical protein